MSTAPHLPIGDLVVIQSQRSIKLDGDDWGELCDNESRVEADEVTRRVDTCARRSARCRWQPPARHLSLLQFFLLHTKYFELFYLELRKVVLPCYLWPIETPTGQTTWTFRRYLGLNTCSSALSRKGDTLDEKKRRTKNKQPNTLKNKSNSEINFGTFNIQRLTSVCGWFWRPRGDPLIEVELLQMDSHMDHTEIPVIETNEPLFDVLPKLYK